MVKNESVVSKALSCFNLHFFFVGFPHAHAHTYFPLFWVYLVFFWTDGRASHGRASTRMDGRMDALLCITCWILLFFYKNIPILCLPLQYIYIVIILQAYIYIYSQYSTIYNIAGGSFCLCIRIYKRELKHKTVQRIYDHFLLRPVSLSRERERERVWSWMGGGDRSPLFQNKSRKQRKTVISKVYIFKYRWNNIYNFFCSYYVYTNNPFVIIGELVGFAPFWIIPS